jgi:hypothetical protein
LNSGVSGIRFSPVGSENTVFNPFRINAPVAQFDPGMRGEDQRLWHLTSARLAIAGKRNILRKKVLRFPAVEKFGALTEKYPEYASTIHLQRRNKSLLRDVDLAELPHLLLAFPLFSRSLRFRVMSPPPHIRRATRPRWPNSRKPCMLWE